MSGQLSSGSTGTSDLTSEAAQNLYDQSVTRKQQDEQASKSKKKVVIKAESGSGKYTVRTDGEIVDQSSIEGGDTVSSSSVNGSIQKGYSDTVYIRGNVSYADADDGLAVYVDGQQYASNQSVTQTQKQDSDTDSFSPLDDAKSAVEQNVEQYWDQSEEETGVSKTEAQKQASKSRLSAFDTAVTHGYDYLVDNPAFSVQETKASAVGTVVNEMTQSLPGVTETDIEGSESLGQAGKSALDDLGEQYDKVAEEGSELTDGTAVEPIVDPTVDGAEALGNVFLRDTANSALSVATGADINKGEEANASTLQIVEALSLPLATSSGATKSATSGASFFDEFLSLGKGADEGFSTAVKGAGLFGGSYAIGKGLDFLDSGGSTPDATSDGRYLKQVEKLNKGGVLFRVVRRDATGSQSTLGYAVFLGSNEGSLYVVSADGKSVKSSASKAGIESGEEVFEPRFRGADAARSAYQSFLDKDEGGGNDRGKQGWSDWVQVQELPLGWYLYARQNGQSKQYSIVGMVDRERRYLDKDGSISETVVLYSSQGAIKSALKAFAKRGASARQPSGSPPASGGIPKDAAKNGTSSDSTGGIASTLQNNPEVAGIAAVLALYAISNR